MLLNERNLQQACSMLEEGQFAQALGRFRAMDGEAVNAEHHYGAALCLLLLWRVDEALVEFSKGFISPHPPRYQLFGRERVRSAEKNLRHWMDLAFRQSPLTLTCWALLLGWLGERSRALELVAKALSSGAYPPAARLRKSLLEQPDPSARMLNFKAELEKLLQEGRIEEAERIVADTWEWEPDDELRRLKASMYRRLGLGHSWLREMRHLMFAQTVEERHQEAISTAYEILRERPQDVEVMERLLPLLDELGDQPARLNWFERLVKRLMVLGRWNDACSWLQWHLARLRDPYLRSQTELLLAEVEFRLGNHESACQRLDLHAAQLSAEALVGRPPPLPHLAAALQLVALLGDCPELSPNRVDGLRGLFQSML